MYVVSTAGHVDHGKSTLVEALTAMDPDRWAEEKERGLTIDLGFAWTQVQGMDVAFVDVPGHERFVSNMLAGLAPVPVVLLVVAADEGWQAQSSDHRDAIAALGVRHGVVALTRSDKASAADIERTRAQVAAELAGTLLADAPVVPVSAHSGAGLEELREQLAAVLLATPRPEGRTRLWIDRAFSITGAGTVVTGTLGQGSIAVGDTVEIPGVGRVQVRGIHSENRAIECAEPITRVALNLRGVEAKQLHRGQQVLGDPWPLTDTVDVRARIRAAEAVAHIGSGAYPVRVRPLGTEFARLRFREPIALEPGDRMVLRTEELIGAEVLDVDVAPLTRRGDAARRAQELHNPAQAYIERVKAVTAEHLEFLGHRNVSGTVEFRGWIVLATAVVEWKQQLIAAVDAQDPLSPLSKAAAIEKLGLPEPLLPLIVAAAQLRHEDGLIVREAPDLGEAVAKLEQRLRERPFDAPEAGELSSREIAAAVRAGKLVRLGAIVLLPDAVEVAVARLRELEQPFSTSQARQALETTRRVAIPLLEHLDELKITRRLEDGTRQLR
ncbi:selenocysteine-specific translation elongation factor [Corynebacterium lizhenjunii]|uniref:selenocysteine-specific translation elongation factor n=1 Tax=Corynebacterium lizhenjunii TaxID=2709394 RepID=UPI0013EDC1EE|nr:selenocysteine-specific translation elongation factor [Corynebacterium lizhenjunii]